MNYTVYENKPCNIMSNKKKEVFLPFFKGVFSQWHPCSFSDPEIDEYKFCSAEQYMMYRKAMLFNDREIAQQILDSTSPSTIKSLGRRVSDFTQDTWDDNKMALVLHANVLKFSNPVLKKKLIDTYPKILVEASPYDQVWGVGLSVGDPRIHNRVCWQGDNLLGQCLVNARSVLMGTYSEGFINRMNPTCRNHADNL
jgi:ribA/ribD-fused uncharacterized protein